MNEEMVNEMECPMCSMEIRSDANLGDYCQICGMGVENGSVFVKRHNRKFHFCSDYCKNKFLKTGFRSFNNFS